MKITAQHLSDLISAISDTLQSNCDRLNQLDAALGDGDHGTGISTAFASAAEEVEKLNSPTEVLKTVAMTIMNRMGGSSGALYGSLFLQASTSAAGKAALSPDDFALMWKSGADGVMQRGKSKVGDKTMLDALLPAVEAMGREKTLTDMLISAADAAQQGAESTAGMIAKHGRAKYLGERGIGLIDAGAVSVALMFEAMRDYWKGLERGET